MLQPSSSPLTHYEFDILISAGGGKFVPEGDSRCPCSPRVNTGGWVGAHSSALRRVQAEGDAWEVGHWHHHQLHQPPQPG